MSSNEKISVKGMLTWFSIIILISAIVGSASAFFLHTLAWSTSFRNDHLNIIYLLPVAGLLVGWSYYKWGKSVEKGNNLIIDEYYHRKNLISILMAPLVYAGTILTHLFGGSAGREGTAVQMGASLSDQLQNWFQLDHKGKKLLLILGVSAGFSSVFGTPLTAAVFALEVLILTEVSLLYIVPSLIVAYGSYYVCLFWNAPHSSYYVTDVPDLALSSIAIAIAFGILCGWVAMLFANSQRWWSTLFKKISLPYVRPVVGGVLLMLFFHFSELYEYAGLGVPSIQKAFTMQSDANSFLLKLLLTTFTLGAGFKGGEVTPLFFVGATLGSALVWVLPLPMGILAGMGFVAVFSGATNTPIACTIMAVELFGMEGVVFYGLACFSAWLSSGYKGIYSSQVISKPKYWLYPKKIFAKKG